MRMVLRRGRSECSDFGNYEKAFHHGEARRKFLILFLFFLFLFFPLCSLCLCDSVVKRFELSYSSTLSSSFLRSQSAAA